MVPASIVVGLRPSAGGKAASRGDPQTLRLDCRLEDSSGEGRRARNQGAPQAREMAL